MNTMHVNWTSKKIKQKMFMLYLVIKNYPIGKRYVITCKKYSTLFFV